MLLLPSLLMFSQKMTDPASFKIENESSARELNQYNSILAKSNLESFRLRDEDVMMEFESGAKVVLFSASSLKSKGVVVDVSKYAETFPEEYTLPIFRVTDSGHLLTLYGKKRK